MNKVSNEEFLQSIGPEAILNSFWSNNYQKIREQCSSGKSGSLFYYSEDQKYIIKTISFSEFYKFRNILQSYYEHLRLNPESLICRFYGLHKIYYYDDKTKKQVKTPILIMGNIFEQFPVEDRYDLKGSKIGRSTKNLDDSNRDKSIALKDQDFEFQQKVLVLKY